jgi:hypothetical protein
VKPGEFYDVATLIQALDAPHPEGRTRSAVSRYYYAAFLEARDQLVSTAKMVFKKNEVHTDVQRAFAWSDDKGLRLIGRLLEDLKKARLQADYDLTAASDPAAAAEAKNMCNQIQERLKTEDITKCKDPRPRRT